MGGAASSQQGPRVGDSVPNVLDKAQAKDALRDMEEIGLDASRVWEAVDASREYDKYASKQTGKITKAQLQEAVDDLYASWKKEKVRSEESDTVVNSDEEEQKGNVNASATKQSFVGETVASEQSDTVVPEPGDVEGNVSVQSDTVVPEPTAANLTESECKAEEVVRSEISDSVVPEPTGGDQDKHVVENVGCADEVRSEQSDTVVDDTPSAGSRCLPEDDKVAMNVSGRADEVRSEQSDTVVDEIEDTPLSAPRSLPAEESKSDSAAPTLKSDANSEGL